MAASCCLELGSYVCRTETWDCLSLSKTGDEVLAYAIASSVWACGSLSMWIAFWECVSVCVLALDPPNLTLIICFIFPPCHPGTFWWVIKFPNKGGGDKTISLDQLSLHLQEEKSCKASKNCSFEWSEVPCRIISTRADKDRLCLQHFHAPTSVNFYRNSGICWRKQHKCPKRVSEVLECTIFLPQNTPPLFLCRNQTFCITHQTKSIKSGVC